MPGKPKTITGKFHITEMNEWDEEDINLVGQGFIEIARDGTGSFQFCAVTGYIDCRWTNRDGKPGFEFTWEGNDECDPVQGRGWAFLDGDELRGHLYFHMGDDSGFVARRAP